MNSTQRFSSPGIFNSFQNQLPLDCLNRRWAPAGEALFSQCVPIPAEPYETTGHNFRNINDIHLGNTFLEGYDTNMRKSTWEAIKPLGSGAFSNVILACPADQYLKPKYQGRAHEFKVAIKIASSSYDDQESGEQMKSSLKQEMDILQDIKHPLLIHMYAFNLDPSATLLILPYCKGGDLLSFVKAYNDRICPDLARRLFGDISKAVAFLHENQVVHRDIKLESKFHSYL